MKSNQMIWVFFLLLSLTMSSGCALFGAARKAVWQQEESCITAYALQQELMRFADDYSSMTREIADDLAAKAKTPMDRVRPLAMKVSQVNATITIASSPNPLAGIMDMTVLVSLTRSSFENYLVPKVYGADAKGVIEKYRKAEAQIWELAAQVMDAKQLDELKQSIDQWRIENPEQHYVSFVRLQNLHKAKGSRDNESKPYGSIFSLLYLDPFAGLDPAARQMEMSRHTAERAMYQFERMPRMLDWQLSLLLSKSLAMPEIQDLIASANRLSTAAQDLPKNIAEERAAIIRELDANEPRLQALLDKFRKALESGGDAAESVNEAVLAIDNFVASCKKESTKGITNSPNAKPFDVTEYGTSAARISDAAREVDTLVNSVDQKILPQAEAVIGHAKSAVAELVDHIFWKTVEFILIMFAGAVVAMLLYRAVALRFLKVNHEQA